MFLLLPLASVAYGRSIPISDDYGKVIIGNFSAQAGLPVVRFDHWMHRAFYTCRLCHVDIGFAMEGNGTKIKADTNKSGYYCGSCHNGKMVHGGRTVFPSCLPGVTPEKNAACFRCHSVGKNVQREYNYISFTEKLPKLGLENLVDWEKAEERGLIRPADILPGISVERPPLRAQKDFSIPSKGLWMPDIIFSHAKHAQWNGCELCHPDVFPSVKKGTVGYSMFQISGGQYCGLCHGTVAFPLIDCEKCHVRPVRR
jgi:c(7)-type cytochrome triheme protein